MQYVPQGVCSRLINIELDGDTIKDVQFVGGCAGNLAAISKLVRGKDAHEIIGLLEGNTCGRRPTSCADQMCQGLKAALAQEKEE